MIFLSSVSLPSCYLYEGSVEKRRHISDRLVNLKGMRSSQNTFQTGATAIYEGAVFKLLLDDDGIFRFLFFAEVSMDASDVQEYKSVSNELKSRLSSPIPALFWIPSTLGLTKDARDLLRKMNSTKEDFMIKAYVAEGEQGWAMVSLLLGLIPSRAPYQVFTSLDDAKNWVNQQLTDAGWTNDFVRGKLNTPIRNLDSSTLD